MSSKAPSAGTERPPVIGVAGGIGSGKSSVARAFADLGCVVLDSDSAAKAALDRPDVRDELARWWGHGVLDAGGRVRRDEVARRIFADSVERARLEALVHPLVTGEHERKIREIGAGWSRAEADAGRAPTGVVLDSPLLFEAGLEGRCDAVVFVESPREARLERVRAGRGWDERELSRREKSQMPLEIKRARADYVVVNDRGPAELASQVRGIFDMIRRGHRSQGV